MTSERSRLFETDRLGLNMKWPHEIINHLFCVSVPFSYENLTPTHMRVRFVLCEKTLRKKTFRCRNIKRSYVCVGHIFRVSYVDCCASNNGYQSCWAKQLQFFLHSTFLQSTLLLLFASDVPIVKPISDDITNYFLLAVFFFVIDQSHSLETMIAIRFERSEKERKNKIRNIRVWMIFVICCCARLGVSPLSCDYEVNCAVLRCQLVARLSFFCHHRCCPFSRTFTAPRPVETGKWSALKNRTVLRRSLMNCVVRIHVHEKWGNSDNCCRVKFFWKTYW